jgi:hypothetical protein
MNSKKSIYVGPPIRDFLERIPANHRNASRMLNGAVARYLAVCRDHAPELTEAEWGDLRDIWRDLPAIFSPRMAVALIEDRGPSKLRDYAVEWDTATVVAAIDLIKLSEYDKP